MNVASALSYASAPCMRETRDVQRFLEMGGAGLEPATPCL
jgi:hypothetical protein